MRTFTLLFSAFVLSTAAQAQTVATFETPVLPTADTFYVNTTAFGHDVGFNNGLAHFPCVYDTSGGYTFFNYFLYSNVGDSITSGFGNQYAAKAYTGYNGSSQYAIAYCSDKVTYEPTMRMQLTGAAVGKSVNGFYVTNSTYAYNSMRDGDGTSGPGKKFGGASGNDADWFLLTVKGYRSGALTPDSVNFYLADYRFTNNAGDFIIKTWEWVNLLPLGHVDSLQFHMSSSDNGSFGMNTPAYFCMDNFTTNETSVGVAALPQAAIAKIYPNPASDVLYVDLADNKVQQVTVADMTGRVLATYTFTGPQVAINTSSLPTGTYVLQLTGNGKAATAKFIKK